MNVVQLPALESFCAAILRHAGLCEGDAATAASVLVLTDSWGVFTHGTRNLAGYVRRLEAGGIRSGARPQVLAGAPAWAFVDADGALGMVAGAFAMDVAIDRARRSGLAYVNLSNTCHFGAAGAYAVRAAGQGMMGFAMSNDTPTVNVPGARGPVLGSNPFAFAAPVEGGEPLLLDIATSTVAGGRVFRAAAEGRTIPEGWVVDAEGRPTTDPAVWPHAGSLTPMAGHKGYGIALMIEILSAVLGGGPAMAQVLSWSFAAPNLATGHSAAFLAIDVSSMPGGAGFAGRVAEALTGIRAQPRAAGAERILTPGEREWAHRREAIANGLTLPEDVLASLRELGTRSGCPFPA